MNKNIVNKYKSEFNAWLEGKPLIGKSDTNTEWKNMPEEYSWNDETLVVLHNDEYVEFRKAEIEGIIVQYLNPNDEWSDKGSMIFQYDVSEYRIKPDDRAIIGKWYRNINLPNVCLKAIILDEQNPEFLDAYKLWEPEVNEWCTFWNDTSTYVVRKFSKTYNTASKIFYTDTSDRRWANVAPVEYLKTLKDQ